MHRVVKPSILYFGTPVVLVSTLNPDGSPNLAPMSSAWWLGWGCMLGFDASSKTTENLRRTRQCVLNLPSADIAGAVDKLALLTGSEPVPPHKTHRGYRHAADKFGIAGLTPQPAAIVGAPRVLECPVQLEATVAHIHPFAHHDPHKATPAYAFEVRIVRVHAAEEILADDVSHRIDPDRWRPLIMSFREFYSLGSRLRPSRLAEGPEEAYAPRERSEPAGGIDQR